MYFSRVRIEPYSISRTKLIRLLSGDMYSSHKLVWKLFPANPEAKRDFLFRQEIEKEQLSYAETGSGLPVFYVVSERTPSPEENIFRIDIKEYDPKISNGMHLGFDVRVNPVIARSRENGKHSAKHDVLADAKKKAQSQGITDRRRLQEYMNKAVRQWLCAKEDKYGFKIIDPELVEISGYRQERLRKKSKKDIQFSSVDLKGRLLVTDSVLFRDLLYRGIGRSRSFGCGLMLVRVMGHAT